jgi:hypothetical protein
MPYCELREGKKERKRERERERERERKIERERRVEEKNYESCLACMLRARIKKAERKEEEEMGTSQRQQQQQDLLAWEQWGPTACYHGLQCTLTRGHAHQWVPKLLLSLRHTVSYNNLAARVNRQLELVSVDK